MWEARVHVLPSAPCEEASSVGRVLCSLREVSVPRCSDGEQVSARWPRQQRLATGPATGTVLARTPGRWVEDC